MRSLQALLKFDNQRTMIMSHHVFPSVMQLLWLYIVRYSSFMLIKNYLVELKPQNKCVLKFFFLEQIIAWFISCFGVIQHIVFYSPDAIVGQLKYAIK